MGSDLGHLTLTWDQITWGTLHILHWNREEQWSHAASLSGGRDEAVHSTNLIGCGIRLLFDTTPAQWSQARPS